MNNKDQQELILAIQTVMPKLVNEWNNTKLPLFESLVEQTFFEYFSGRQTQEKTKMIAPILDSVFARLMKKVINGFDISEGKGQDYLFRETPFESKITFGLGDSWTGNGYSKTPWHLLMRFELDENGHITKEFAMITDLAKCKSQWTAPGTTSNFSTLRFLTEDLDELVPIVGTVTRFTRTGKPGKYVMPTMLTHV